MEKRRILNASECRADGLLCSALHGTGYRLFARLPLAKVFQRQRGERLTKEDKRFLKCSELDFVVANSDSIPAFAVEFDGPWHQLAETEARDVRKNRLCSMAMLPLLRITDTELEEFDRYTILEFIVMRFLAWRAESPGIERRIHEHISKLDERHKEALLEGGIAHPCIDPTFHFDIAHPFPRTKDVAKRLLDRHGIVSVLAEPFLKEVSPPKSFRLFSDVFAPSQCRYDGHDLVVRCDYIVSRSAEPFFGTKSIANAQDRHSSQVLKKGAIDFRLRASLPIVSDYDPQEAPIDYFMREGEIPISFHQLPGVTPHNIGETVSEYLGFREVEKWADKENPR